MCGKAEYTTYTPLDGLIICNSHNRIFTISLFRRVCSGAERPLLQPSGGDGQESLSVQRDEPAAGTGDE